MEKISFIISNYNTVEYTKLCYDSLRKNLSKEHEIILLSDGSTDGTNDLLNEISKLDNNVKIYINSESQIGIAYMYNMGVKMASNEVVCVLHSDMVIPPNFDSRMLTHLHSGIDFLTSYRVEPPLYPESLDKHQANFGLTWDTFDMQSFIEFSEKNYKKNKMKTQQRTCFPWMTTKTVYNSVGGNDTLFLKYMVDDDDFYYRIMLKGYRYEQVLDTCVYHFCSRSTKYENDNVTSNGSNKWNLQYMKSTKNFIRKWGFHQGMVYGSKMELVRRKSFKKCLVVDSLPDNMFLVRIEPYYDSIYIKDVESRNKLVAELCSIEQVRTLFNLKDKFVDSVNKNDYTLIVTLKHSNIINEIFEMLTGIHFEIAESDSGDMYENDDMILEVNDFKETTDEKIVNTRIFDKYEH